MQVAVLFIADTLNSVFDMWWIYNVVINNFGTLIIVYSWIVSDCS